jgi:hypothetical protein
MYDYEQLGMRFCMISIRFIGQFALIWITTSYSFFGDRIRIFDIKSVLSSGQIGRLLQSYFLRKA